MAPVRHTQGWRNAMEHSVLTVSSAHTGSVRWRRRTCFRRLFLCLRLLRLCHCLCPSVSFPPGRLFATLDKPYYVPGEVVTGQIVADLSMPVSARGIDLLVTGYEKAEWHDVSNESESDPNGGFKHFKKAVRHRGERNEQHSIR